MRRLPHAQARWVLMIFSVCYSLAHTLLASHAFNAWLTPRSPLTFFNGSSYETAASRSGAMGADDDLVFGTAWLTPCSPLTLARPCSPLHFTPSVCTAATSCAVERGCGLYHM
eukprot:scaffold94555_cov65-Phaeocystis_antarctica.AAC.1